MPSSLLSLISEGHSPPHAFSSASPKQGSRTHFNTSESLYTTDSQAAAVMYISEQPLLWGVRGGACGGSIEEAINTV